MDGEALRSAMQDGRHDVGEPVGRRRLPHNRLPGFLVELYQLAHLKRTQSLAKNRRNRPSPLSGDLTIHQAAE